MTTNCYDVGDSVRLSIAIANSAGAAVDPTTLTLTVKPGTGTATVYTYALGQITKDSTGNYHMDYTIAAHGGGMYYYKWVAAGAAIGAEPGSFAVRSDETA